MTTSRVFSSRSSIFYLLSAVVAFGLVASACSSSTESTDAASDSDDTTTESAAEATNSEDDSTTSIEVADLPATAEVTIDGDALPEMNNDSEDPAIGLVAPEITGTDMNGDPVSITNDGRAKAVYFVAHWCPHCQEEVPVLTELIKTDQQPADLDIYAVSTVVDEGKGNFPPSQWLANAGFDAPTIRDSEGNEALLSYGAGGFPYVVYLDADHKVVNRTSGQLGSEEIVNLWTETAG